MELIVEYVIVVDLIAMVHVLVALGAVASLKFPMIRGQFEQLLAAMRLSEILKRGGVILHWCCVLVVSFAATLAPTPAHTFNGCRWQWHKVSAGRAKPFGLVSGVPGLFSVVIHHMAGLHVPGLGYGVVQLGRTLQHIVEAGSGRVVCMWLGQVEQPQRHLVVGKHVALDNNCRCSTQQQQSQLQHCARSVGLVLGKVTFINVNHFSASMSCFATLRFAGYNLALIFITSQQLVFLATEQVE